jgi:hypothetical protein
VVGRNPKIPVIIAGINAFYRLSPVWPIGQLLAGIASVHHHSSDPNRGKAADLRFIKVRSRLILRSYEWLSNGRSVREVLPPAH